MTQSCSPRSTRPTTPGYLPTPRGSRRERRPGGSGRPHPAIADPTASAEGRLRGAAPLLAARPGSRSNGRRGGLAAGARLRRRLGVGAAPGLVTAVVAGAVAAVFGG